jgi:hypothetical protein
MILRFYPISHPGGSIPLDKGFCHPIGLIICELAGGVFAKIG